MRGLLLVALFGLCVGARMVFLWGPCPACLVAGPLPTLCVGALVSVPVRAGRELGGEYPFFCGRGG